MSENTQHSDTPLGLYATPRREGFTFVEAIACLVSIAWVLMTGAFFLFFAEPSGTTRSAYQAAVILMAVFLPAILVWVAAASARSGQIIREESMHLQDAAAVIRQAAMSQSQPQILEMQSEAQLVSASRQDALINPRARPDPAVVPFSTSRSLEVMHEHPDTVTAPAALEADQPGLPFDPQNETVHPPLTTSDFIQAMNFPETAEDKAGFDALRRALRHREAAQIIQASQDVLTLLSQDGIYMDDLTPDMAHPDLWRRFAAGERGRQIAALGGIRDRSSLALSAARMKQDTIFRDASHHFLRLYDRMMSRFCEAADDAEISALSDTRTSRAFMLLGRAAGTFD
ncbi:MAG: hypothetical protein AAF678_00925 [Pseudomonadota bacterium]